MSLRPSNCNAIKEPASAPQKPSWQLPGVLFTQIPGPQLSGPGLGWGSASLPFLTSCQVPASALLVHSLPPNSRVLWCQDGDTAPLPHCPCHVTVKNQVREPKAKSVILFSLNVAGNHCTKNKCKKKSELLLEHINMYVYVSYVLNVFLKNFTQKISFNLIKSYAIFN